MLEQQSQEFCDYHRADENPARINFCQLANDAGIQCPQVDADKDICVTIWQNQDPNITTDSDYDKLCQSFVIPHSSVKNSDGVYEWYSYPYQKMTNYRSFYDEYGEFEIGEFPINECYQWINGSMTKAELWMDNGPDWYVRIVPIDR